MLRRLAVMRVQYLEDCQATSQWWAIGMETGGERWESTVRGSGCWIGTATGNSHRPTANSISAACQAICRWWETGLATGTTKSASTAGVPGSWTSTAMGVSNRLWIGY